MVTEIGNELNKEYLSIKNWLSNIELLTVIQVLIINVIFFININVTVNDTYIFNCFRILSKNIVLKEA